MTHFLGFIVFLLSARLAFNVLGVGAEYYFDEVALIIVLGGTLTVTLISFPMSYLVTLVVSPFQMLFEKKNHFEDTVETLVRTSQAAQTSKSAIRELVDNQKTEPFLKEGLELFLLDIDRNDFKNIMTERIYRARQREEEQIALFRKLAKYPPAFGLVGTVLGLVSLMRTVGDGAAASEIAMRMALALVATLYGLAFANFILAPLAEHFTHKADDLKVFRELQVEGLLMIYDRKSPLVVQEMLNSFLDVKDRLDVVGLKEGFEQSA
ncbi:MAG: MotA/TolQ/ExbB proton channel family protein [Bdellovibrionaceae bacterium]|nr:MotA/TolQ/ExbB proton channel family protein [Pseudobdellovibrionaceae bacterium]